MNSVGRLREKSRHRRVAISARRFTVRTRNSFSCYAWIRQAAHHREAVLRSLRDGSTTRFFLLACQCMREVSSRIVIIFTSVHSIHWEAGGQGPLYTGRKVVKGRCTLGGRWSRAAVHWEGGGQGPLYTGREVVKGRCTLGGRWSRAAVHWEGGGQGPLYTGREVAKGRCTLCTNSWCIAILRRSFRAVGREGVTQKSALCTLVILLTMLVAVRVSWLSVWIHVRAGCS